MIKAISSEQHELTSKYETVRRKLLDERNADRLDKPLAFWALPNDRRLPLVLLDRKLSDLLAHPLEDISSTPGVGQKKITAMIKLLLRASKEEPGDDYDGIAALAAVSAAETGIGQGMNGFDAALVSESHWVRWKETIREHQVQQELLGRLAPALTRLPTVIWQRPLSYYMQYSLAEIRRLKTHGAKRVSAVLEIFHLVHRVLQTPNATEPTQLRLMPQFAVEVETWVRTTLASDVLPSVDELRKSLTLPLLAQAKVDVGNAVYKLAEGRLGIKAKPQAVRSQSRRLGVTRARVYQLLEECGKAMAVRWPEGRSLLTQLAEKHAAASDTADAQELLAATRELFFPSRFDEVTADVAPATEIAVAQ